MVFLQNVFYSKKCEIVFSFNVKDNNIGPCSHNIRLSFFYKMLQPIKMLHKTVKMVVFFVKNNENTYPKERALMQIYRVVCQMNRENLINMSCLIDTQPHSDTSIFRSITCYSYLIDKLSVWYLYLAVFWSRRIPW